ncbi:hypothetical protein ACI8AG_10750 [Blastococcus sp. SYSU DS0552]
MTGARRRPRATDELAVGVLVLLAIVVLAVAIDVVQARLNR